MFDITPPDDINGLIQDNPDHTFQIIAVSTEDGHWSWNGTAFERFDEDNLPGFIDTKAFTASEAKSAYNAATRPALIQFKQGKLQLLPIPPFHGHR